MMKFTLYTADCRGNRKNAVYPNKRIIEDEESFADAVAYDHVCAKYKRSHRGNDDFEYADCTPMDNDNDHSDNPEDWIYPEDYGKMLPDVAYVVAPSRHNMKEKDGKAAIALLALDDKGH